MTALPASFEARVRLVFGSAGRRWLAALPDLLATYAARWALTLGEPYPLSYSYVTRATRADGTPAVLKLAVPGRHELACQLTTLTLLGGRGAAALLEADGAGGAMLLERVEPGTPLAELAETDDTAATAVLLDVMRRLHRPAVAGTRLPTTADWGGAFAGLRERHGGGTGPLPAATVRRAERTWAELLDSAAPPVLLHGDLHHDNVLRSDRDGWLAVDAKGVLGEPAFEVGPLMLNPWTRLLEWPDPGRVLARRVGQLAEGLGVDAERVRRWGFAFAVVSSIWMEEDEGAPDEYSLACAELLDSL